MPHSECKVPVAADKAHWLVYWLVKCVNCGWMTWRTEMSLGPSSHCVRWGSITPNLGFLYHFFNFCSHWQSQNYWKYLSIVGVWFIELCLLLVWPESILERQWMCENFSFVVFSDKWCWKLKWLSRSSWFLELGYPWPGIHCAKRGHSLPKNRVILNFNL